MADLKQFEADLTAEHDKLTKAFLDAQVKAEAAWEDQEARARDLVDFRAKYGRVLKVLSEGRVTVTAGDVATVKAETITPKTQPPKQ